jgi:hypothetical protein
VAEVTRSAAERFKGDPFTATGAGAATIDTGRSCNWGGTDKVGTCFPRLANAAGGWDDKWLTFEAEDDKWLISDIVYDPGKSVQGHPSLTDLLKSIIAK